MGSILFWLFFSVVQAVELKNTDAPGSTDDISAAITAGFFANCQQNQAFRELTCIRSKAEKGSLFASCVAGENIKLLAPFLQDAFDRVKMGPRERSLFYSQILVESSYLTKFAETQDHTPRACQEGADSKPVAPKDCFKVEETGDAAIRDIIAISEDDTKFGQRKGARHSRNFGEFRGRGLIQLTRCDNYLSVIDYLNKQYRGQSNPDWQPAWHTGAEQKKSNQLGAVCEKDELDAMMKRYSDVHQGKMSLNLYDAIENPNNFGMPRTDLKDAPSEAYPSSGDKLMRSITGEKFMVDSAMAYWRGRCGDAIKSFITNPKNGRSVYCPPGREAMTENEALTKCMTGCIKGIGSMESWEKRKHWYERAQECVEK